MKPKLIITLAAFVGLISGHAFSQNLTSAYIDSIVESSMNTMPHAGIAVAVIQNGKILHSKGYGIASMQTGEKVNDHTLFSIASNSKAFTTFAISMLVEEGEIRWLDKVVDIIPEFKMYDAYVTENFTIQDLVTHRSGLGLGAGDLMFIPDGSDFKMEDILTSFQHQTPTSAFRTKYDYDNLLYIVAGEIIHRVSGLDWDDFIEQRIMKPLDMNESAGYLQNVERSNNIAKPHSVSGNTVEQINEYSDPNKVFGPAGGIYASVSDLSKWMLMHLNDGKYGSELENRLLEPENHSEMWRAYTNVYFNHEPKGPYKTHYRAYGLGWFLTDQNGYTIVSHTGGMPGMLSQTVLIPELDAGIVVLTNCDPGGYSFVSVTNALKDVLIGAEAMDWVSNAKTWIEEGNHEADSVVSQVWQTVKDSKSKKIDFQNFIGEYEDDWFGKIRIEDREGKLWFSSIRSPRLNGQMYFYQANTFAIKWEYEEMKCDAFAMFNLDEYGVAQSIKMKGISPAIDFSFDFHDLDLKRVE